MSVQEHGGWETRGGGEWAQGDAKLSRESIISEPLWSFFWLYLGHFLEMPTSSESVSLLEGQEGSS